MQHNKKLTPLAQALRKEMTKEEKQLWYQFLRNYPAQFKRQVTCGKYILDFYCAKAQLAIELDGSQHFEPEAVEKDRIRTQYLNSIDILVLRFPNNQVWKNFRGICNQIDFVVRSRTSSVSFADTFPKGEG